MPIDCFSRPISQTILALFHRHTHPVRCGPGPAFVPAILPTRTFWTVEVGDRLFHDPLAACGGHHGCRSQESIRRHPRRHSRGLGLALTRLGMVLLAMLQATRSSSTSVWRMASFGCGWLFQAREHEGLESSAPADRRGQRERHVATARLTGNRDRSGVAHLFGLVGREGATLDTGAWSVFATAGCGMSVLRLVGAREARLI